MTIVCIQCSMKAMLEDKPPPVFEETVEDHIRVFHSDLIETQLQRADMEQRLAAKLRGLEA